LPSFKHVLDFDCQAGYQSFSLSMRGAMTSENVKSLRTVTPEEKMTSFVSAATRASTYKRHQKQRVVRRKV